jgi:hypothetical protein
MPPTEEFRVRIWLPFSERLIYDAWWPPYMYWMVVACFASVGAVIVVYRVEQVIHWFRGRDK